MTAPLIVVSAVVLRDPAGRVLTVRKRDTARFQFPGGKPDPGEDAAACAVREVAEETGLQISVPQLRAMGVFTAPAGNESNRWVRADVFAHPLPSHPLPAQPHAGAEIDEIAWVDPNRPSVIPLAPLLTDQVFPLLVAGAADGQRGASARES